MELQTIKDNRTDFILSTERKLMTLSGTSLKVEPSLDLKKMSGLKGINIYVQPMHFTVQQK